jgi:isopentenyl-diphosphate delta-isomerase
VTADVGRGPELVVLVDDQGRPIGAAPKSEVHHAATPLHLAFSCWVFDDQRRTLLTQRAAGKGTWPGAWTNAFCGHPAPGEAVRDAVHRRAKAELGTLVSEPEPLLADFRYRAVMDDGTVENEICPVFGVHLMAPLAPNPAEVGDFRWVRIAELTDLVDQDVDVYSPWMREQFGLLRPGLG